MRDAISNWFFEKGDETMRFNVDNCGDLPCTKAAQRQRCPHTTPSPGPSPGPPRPPSPPGPPTPISDACKAELLADCPGEKGKGATCAQCVRAHAQDLKSHGCPQEAA